MAVRCCVAFHTSHQAHCLRSVLFTHLKLHFREPPAPGAFPVFDVNLLFSFIATAALHPCALRSPGTWNQASLALHAGDPKKDTAPGDLASTGLFSALFGG